GSRWWSRSPAGRSSVDLAACDCARRQSDRGRQRERKVNALLRTHAHADGLSPADALRRDLDLHARWIDPNTGELTRDVGTKTAVVATDLAGEARRMRGDRLGGEPALEYPTELDHAEEERDEDDDHERRLDRRES